MRAPRRATLRDHLDAFLEAARRHADGAPRPAFVKQEFRDFPTCGVPVHGFARLRCTACAVERLVLFSCKGRGFCPSGGGRRMAESAARLVDEMLPRAPVRQWVLSLPYRLRYLLAWDHGLARAVLGVYLRVSSLSPCQLFLGDHPYALAQAPPISMTRSLSLSRSVRRKGSTACS